MIAMRDDVCRPKPTAPRPRPKPKPTRALAFAGDLLAVIGLPVATFGLLVVTQAGQLGYLPAPTEPYAPTPSLLIPADEGMGRAPKAALLDAIEAEKQRAAGSPGPRHKEQVA